MIIVSQDGRIILNFDNIIGLQISYKNIETHLINGNSLYIGEYNTKERAKEVLQEIIKTHKISESYKYTRDVDLQSALTAEIETRNLILFRYEMPQE